MDETKEQSDGSSEKWYPIYNRAMNAGKSLWISIEDGGFKEWVENAKRLVKRYGSDSIFLLFPIMEEENADELIARMEKHN